MNADADYRLRENEKEAYRYRECNVRDIESKSLSRSTADEERENSGPILTDFPRRGDTKAISRIRIPRGLRWLFLFMRKPP